MLVWGISNPEGVDQQNSIYLTKNDIPEMVRQIDEACVKGQHIPVRIEHKGVDLGKVVSAWEHDGKMECILDINENILEGSIGSEFIKQGITNDLSMGYEISLENSKNAKMQVRKKYIKEISIVKKGLRRGCHMRGVCSSKK
jgi:hypothetical protein